jgi:filamentous hemagglutinin
MPIQYDKKAARFRDNRRRLISSDSIRRQIEKSVEMLGKDFRALSKRLNENQISFDEWKGQMREKIKSLHVLSAAVGRGGRRQMSKSDWGKVGAKIKKEYNFLENFAEEVKKGHLSGSRLEYRASLYARSARTTFAEAEKTANKNVGKILCRRVVHAIESCEECRAWARKGFISIDKQPPIGSLICRSNCRCQIEYAKSAFGSNKFGALGSWERIEEKEDLSIVKQKDGTCVAAAGEMLAQFHGLKVSQDEIIKNIGPWSNSTALARYLNSIERRNNVKWKSGFFSPDDFPYITGITKSDKVWVVMLRDMEAVGHAVLIDGMDTTGLIIIKDPFDQTTYKMKAEELHRVLSEYVVVVKKK